ncbi:MAG: UvrD-helicase domain-containing protein [Clostridiales bacterium]|nr:UvrD-helicase domain-containing protein [Clostridiales bacterium]
MNLLTDLNERQKAAVEAGPGPMLIIAGAGSGKTKVLVSRAAYLMSERGIAPQRILAVTFTNKAAREMRERLEQMTGLDMRRLWLGTFHALCARILRIESASASLDQNYVIYDDGDTQSLLKKIITEMELDEKKYPPRMVASRISDAKNKLQTPSGLSAAAGNSFDEKIAAVYKRYQRRLRENNALDFDDLIMETVLLFQKEKDVLAKYQEKFQHILVDEYQDINHSQYILVKLLAKGHGNICVVGDPDQSIYAWRGADIQNILDFEKDYPDCRVIKLTQNYRSTQTILAAANSVISRNSGRKEKELWSDLGKGEKIVSHLAANDKEEAVFVLRNVAMLCDQGRRFKDFAILYRAHSQSRSFEEACIKYNTPYRVFGGVKFYERKEIKDSIAYLRLAANPHDGMSLFRVYNEPRRGIGKATWDKLEREAELRESSVFAVMEDESRLSGLGKAPGEKLRVFRNTIRRLHAFAAANPSTAELLRKIWEETSYKESLEGDEEQESRLENLGELYNVARDFDAGYDHEEGALEGETPLSAFLARVALATDMDDLRDNENYVTLLTLHAAKGLEFPVVFMVNMEEKVFPHARSLGDERELEEERRLCYVGMTRAKERLFFTRAAKRLLWGNFSYNDPSRFLLETPKELLSESGQAFGPDIMPEDRRARHAPTHYDYDKKPAYGQNTNVFVNKSPQPPQAKNAPSAEAAALGDKVRHDKFGVGVVVSLSGTGETLTVGVAFPNQGIKQLIWSYAPMKKI